MSSGYVSGAKILLKARPTAAQIADRLASPLPDGIEFYLDAADIAGDNWLEGLAGLVLASRPEGFEFVVEGPLRSLDGTFFDVTNLSPANREVIDRLASFGKRIGAKAAVIHAMAPRPSAVSFDDPAHVTALEQAAATFRYYSSACRAAGLIPTVENVPPVARMREGSFMYSLIGTPPDDLLALVEQAPGLRVTLDVSHGQLYVNAFTANPAAVPPALRPMVEYVRRQPGATSLDTYIDRVAGHLAEAHISNAQGLLGEGLPYCEGDLDLDRIIRRLDEHTTFLVTETIETNADQALLMRQAQRHIAAALGRDGRTKG